MQEEYPESFAIWCDVRLSAGNSSGSKKALAKRSGAPKEFPARANYVDNK